MKNFLIAVIAGCIPALALNNGAKAQSSANNFASLDKQSVIKINKSVFPAEKANTANLDAVSTKAMKAFKKSYENVSDEKWTSIKDGFTAKFNLDGISSTVFYSKSGKWEGSLKCYSENKLPVEIRNIVKRTYFDDKITQVQEIETGDTQGAPTYIVHLEGADDFKLIRVSSEGEMDVYEEFKKN